MHLWWNIYIRCVTYSGWSATYSHNVDIRRHIVLVRGCVKKKVWASEKQNTFGSYIYILGRKRNTYCESWASMVDAFITSRLTTGPIRMFEYCKENATFINFKRYHHRIANFIYGTTHFQTSLPFDWSLQISGM